MTVSHPRKKSGRAPSARPDPETFVRDNTHLRPVPSLPAVRLHTAHEATGLWRLADGDDPPPPYWAFPWAGGLALAHHMAAHPEAVRGRRVLDLGSGSGLVAIAAMRAGAASVVAAEIDPYAVAACRLNAVANDVTITVLAADILDGDPPAVDIVVVGDLFYDESLAERVTVFLDRCLAANLDVLIGDPRRAYLPYGRIRLVADYAVPDVGDVEGAISGRAGTFTLDPPGDEDAT